MVTFLVLVFAGIIVLMFIKGTAGSNLASAITADSTYFVGTLLGG